MIAPIRIAALCLVLALAGCATGAGGGPALYMLDHSTPTRAASPAAGRPAIVVEPVDVAPFLDASGIVYQTAAHRVVLANDNRWASPLSAQLTDGLYAGLATELDGVFVQRAGRGEPDAALHLGTRVDEFMGHYDGSAHIAGQWTLTDAAGRQLAQARFERRIPLSEDGYEALVASLSRGWRQSAQAIAAEIAPRLENDAD
ncbi:PqiC family protein [Salinisphaera orenii]|uniref:PqiC family protein n=1 Tax=Salinisphaera orenii TaxID=856731 RepID=UPI000F47BCF8|nr:MULTISPECIES: ABC-type transport auxiliary lipoprotein family protein [Salinisphaera]